MAKRKRTWTQAKEEAARQAREERLQIRLKHATSEEERTRLRREFHLRENNKRAKMRLTPAQMKKRHKKRQRKLRAVKREQLLDFRRSFCDMLSAHITKTAGEAYWRWTSRQN